MRTVSSRAVDVGVCSRANYFHWGLLCLQRILLAPNSLNDTPLLFVDQLSLLVLASAAAQCVYLEILLFVACTEHVFVALTVVSWLQGIQERTLDWSYRLR